MAASASARRSRVVRAIRRAVSSELLEYRTTVPPPLRFARYIAESACARSSTGFAASSG